MELAKKKKGRETFFKEWKERKDRDARELEERGEERPREEKRGGEARGEENRGMESSESSKIRSKIGASAPQADMLYRDSSPLSSPVLYDTPGIKCVLSSTNIFLPATPARTGLGLIEDSSFGANLGVNTEGRLESGHGLGSIEASGSAGLVIGIVRVL